MIQLGTWKSLHLSKKTNGPYKNYQFLKKLMSVWELKPQRRWECTSANHAWSTGHTTKCSNISTICSSGNERGKRNCRVSSAAVLAHLVIWPCFLVLFCSSRSVVFISTKILWSFFTFLHQKMLFLFVERQNLRMLLRRLDEVLDNLIEENTRGDTGTRIIFLNSIHMPTRLFLRKTEHKIQQRANNVTKAPWGSRGEVLTVLFPARLNAVGNAKVSEEHASLEEHLHCVSNLQQRKWTRKLCCR